MKITKEKLIEIIKEELENTNQEAQEQGQEEEVKAKSALAKKFRNLSLEVSRMDLDSAEIVLLNSILDSLLSYANENSGASRLRTLQGKLASILGI